MVEPSLNTSSNGSCTLWTPWGPQATVSANPKLSSLRRTLRKMAVKKDGRRQDKLKAAYSSKPECAYEP